MPKVKFLPQDVEFEIEPSESVLLLAQKHDIHIQSVCKGLPSCAECRVQILDGEHHVLPPSSKELALIGTAHYVDHSRLACQLRCYGDLIVDLKEQVAKENKVTKKLRGHVNKAPEESVAVLGNIIEEYTEDDDKLLAKGDKSRDASQGKDDFYDSFEKKKTGNKKRNKNRNRNRSRNSGSTQNAASPKKEEGASGEGSATKKKRRRRKRKPQGDRSQGSKPQA